MTTLPEPAVSRAELADEMKRATKAIRRALAGLAPGCELQPESLLEVFQGVHRVRESRPVQKPRERGSSDLDYVRCEAAYRDALADWNRHLPRVHGWLLAERARLESRNGHVSQVRAWMDADRQTR